MYEYNAKVIRVIDGDTFVANVDLGFHIIIEETFRVLDIDTPEIFKPKSPEEKALGQKAKEKAKALLENKEVILQTKKKDKYGRYLTSVTLEGGKDFVLEMES